MSTFDEVETILKRHKSPINFAFIRLNSARKKNQESKARLSYARRMISLRMRRVVGSGSWNDTIEPGSTIEAALAADSRYVQLVAAEQNAKQEKKIAGDEIDAAKEEVYARDQQMREEVRDLIQGMRVTASQIENDKLRVTLQYTTHLEV